MPIFNMYKGGRPVEAFPNCDSRREFKLPYPESVAGEYDRGHFTLGDSVWPKINPYQAAALKNVVAGDTVNVLVVPEEHRTTALFVKTEPVAPLTTLGNCGTVGCAANSMAGVTINIVASLYNIDDDALVDPPLSTLVLPANLSGLDANVLDSEYAPFIQYVPIGQVMLIGIQYVTGPTTPGLTIADVAGRISVVAKVEDFKFPFVN